jgi:hypothetical protein
VPEEVQNYFSLLWGLNAGRNNALREEIRCAVTVLNSVGIEPMLLKGAAALQAQAGTDIARMVGDIDLLLPKFTETKGLYALHEVGFCTIRTYPVTGHSIADLEQSGNRACIDLHRAILDPPFHDLLTCDDLFARAGQAQGSMAGWLLPSARDCMLHEVFHAQILGENYYCRRLCLRSASEVVRLAPLIDWDELEHWVKSHGLLPVLEATLLCACDIFGMAWPLTGPPSTTALWHHQRAYATETEGAWDKDLNVLERLRESFAFDRLAMLFGVERWYGTMIAAQCCRFVRRHEPRSLLLRLFADRN